MPSGDLPLPSGQTFSYKYLANKKSKKHTKTLTDKDDDVQVTKLVGIGLLRMLLISQTDQEQLS